MELGSSPGQLLLRAPNPARVLPAQGCGSPGRGRLGMPDPPGAFGGHAGGSWAGRHCHSGRIEWVTGCHTCLHGQK